MPDAVSARDQERAIIRRMQLTSIHLTQSGVVTDEMIDDFKAVLSQLHDYAQERGWRKLSATALWYRDQFLGDVGRDHGAVLAAAVRPGAGEDFVQSRKILQDVLAA